jgi:hypothetical protein
MNNPMTWKQLAHSVRYEWIEDVNYGVCVRPMCYDDNGLRLVSYYPDPGEFESREDAIKRLEAVLAYGPPGSEHDDELRAEDRRDWSFGQEQDRERNR